MSLTQSERKDHRFADHHLPFHLSVRLVNRSTNLKMQNTKIIPQQRNEGTRRQNSRVYLVIRSRSIEWEHGNSKVVSGGYGSTNP